MRREQEEQGREAEKNTESVHNELCSCEDATGEFFSWRKTPTSCQPLLPASSSQE